MDLDDIFPSGGPGGPVLGEELSQLSVEDLRARIAALQAEIKRVEHEIETRQSLRSAAEDVFKS